MIHQKQPNLSIK